MGETPKTIMLRGKQFTLRREGKAAAAITPGMLVTYNSSGLVIKHATAKGQTPAWFAFENELFGSGIDDAYAANDQVLIECCPSGSEVYAIVAAAAAAIAIGDGLESDGAGGLRKATPFSQSGTTPFAAVEAGHVIAIATEAVDNSGGGSPARIRAAIL